MKQYLKWLFTRWWYYGIVIIIFIYNLINLQVSINETSFIIGLIIGEFIFIGLIVFIVKWIYLKVSKS